MITFKEWVCPPDRKDAILPIYDIFRDDLEIGYLARYNKDSKVFVFDGSVEASNLSAQDLRLIADKIDELNNATSKTSGS